MPPNDPIQRILSGPIQDHLSTPVPTELWHYTSMPAMHAIVDQGEMYGTDARFLNDKDELIHAAAYAQRLIAAEAREPDVIKFVQAHVADWFRVLLDLRNPHRNYVTCFSSKKDDLSQWRAYSSTSVGASIGFDFRNARPGTVAPCIYRDEDKRKLFTSAFIHIFEVAEMHFRADPRFLLMPREKASQELLTKFPAVESNVRGASTTLLVPLLKLIPLLKNSAFEAESEWRIVTLNAHHNDNPEAVSHTGPRSVFYRPRVDALVPTISIDMRTKMQVPITGVVLGPGSHPYAHDAVRRFLESKNIPANAEFSSVPYRNTSTSQSW